MCMFYSSGVVFRVDMQIVLFSKSGLDNLHSVIDTETYVTFSFSCSMRVNLNGADFLDVSIMENVNFQNMQTEVAILVVCKKKT